MNYAKIRKLDVTNGPGIRTTLFVVDVLIIAKGVLIKSNKILIMEISLLKKQKMNLFN